jgi:hypothetical protein
MTNADYCACLERVAALFPLRHNGRASELRTLIKAMRRMERDA